MLRGVVVLVLLGLWACLPACASSDGEDDLVTLAEIDTSRWVVAEEVFDVEPPGSILTRELEPDEGRYVYALGPGDVLEISVWEDETMSGEYRIGPDGDITLPLFGTVTLGGLSRDEAAQVIAERVADAYVDPHVAVIVQEFNNNNVFLLGAFVYPGEYKLEGRATLLQALSQAKGFADAADRTGLTITRGKDTVYRINLDELLLGGQLDLNVSLRPGDVIFLPENSQRIVHVLGEVQHPGLVPVGRSMDLLRAVAGAGGFTEDAVLDEVRVLRRAGDKVRVLTIDVERLLEDGAVLANIPLEPEDIVYVPEKGLAQFNYVLRQISPALSTILVIDAVSDVGN